jgi:hypothetical protein
VFNGRVITGTHIPLGGIESKCWWGRRGDPVVYNGAIWLMGDFGGGE